MNKLQEHPNILNSLYCNPEGKMRNGIKHDQVQYNILELAENGPVSKYVRITGSLEEDLVRFMFLQLSDAVRFVHTNKFAHLDLKLENILLDSYYNIKLADMGVAYELPKVGTKCNLRRGTLHYMAPEVMDLKKGDEYDALKADVYSLGVCLYILLIGDFPDHDLLTRNSLSTNESDQDIAFDVEMSDNKNSTKKWDLLSENCKSLLLQMLNSNPETRPSIEDVLEHSWFDGINYEEVQNNLFSEMIYRKKFISSFPTRKSKVHS